jgi:hypothetical protein
MLLLNAIEITLRRFLYFWKMYYETQFQNPHLVPRSKMVELYLHSPYILLHVHTLLGNVLVNKFPRRQILCKQSDVRLRNNRGGCIFYVVRATPSSGNGPVNSQSDTWHVFSALSMSRLYNNTCPLLVQESFFFSSEVPGWLNKKWQDDFIVIWSASSVLRSVARRRLVKTEDPSACARVNWKVCKSAIALY